MQIRDVVLGVVAAIPYVLIAQFGFGIAGLFVYGGLFALMWGARTHLIIAHRTISMAATIILVGLTWSLAGPRYALLSALLVVIGFMIPLYLAWRLRKSPWVAMAVSTALFLVVLIALEAFRFTPAFLSMSWAVPGYARIVSIAGHIPVSILLFGSSAGIVLTRSRAVLIVCVLLIFVPMLAMLAPGPVEPLDVPVRIAVVQPDFDEQWAWRQEHALDAVLKRLIDPTAEAIRSGAEVVVWPEHSIPVDVRGTDLDKVLSDFVDRANATLIVGTFELIENGSESYYPGARVYAPDEEVRFARAHSPIGTSPHPRGIGRAETVTITTAAGPLEIGFLICYEEFTNAHWLEGTDAIFVLSDYSDLGNTRRITRQATIIQSHRFGIPIIRAANTGPSLIIASNGSILEEGTIGSAQLLIADVE